MLNHHHLGDEGLISLQVPMQACAVGPGPPVSGPSHTRAENGVSVLMPGIIVHATSAVAWEGWY
jgi:hypothetical protein